ncbi:hypothetical protein GCM10008904_26380 [Paraclostridium ghonii]
MIKKGRVYKCRWKSIIDINKFINQGKFQHKIIEISPKRWYPIKRKSKKNVVIIYKINLKIGI